MKTAKQIPIILFLLAGAAQGHAQSLADSLMGKWKFAGSELKKVDAGLPYEKFTAGTSTPKYEYVEFKAEGECIFNEENQEDAGGEYSISGRKLNFGGAVYQVKFTGKDHVALSRELYYYVDNDKKVLVRKEVLNFKRIF
jgi:hypothetical protein